MRRLLQAGLLSVVLANRAPAELPSEWIERDGVRMHLVLLEPMLATMNNENLISLLDFESQTVELVPRPARNQVPAFLEPRTKEPALAWGFAPVVDSIDLWPNGRHPDHSPVITELVRRGLSALPQLIAHLSDRHPTRLVSHQADFGRVGVADHYDNRYADRPPPGVNTVANEGDSSITHERPYVYTVGDLCLRTILQIVNRSPEPPGRAMGHVSIINSPTRYPQLAAAVQADWGGLTAAQHEASLVADANEWSATGAPRHRAIGALERLLFYYPATGRSVAERCLGELIAAHAREPENRALPIDDGRLFLQLSPYDWPGYRTLAWEFFRTVLSRRSNCFPQSVICVRLLAGQGHDEELSAYLRRLIDENRQAAQSPNKNRYERDTLLRYNEHYERVARDIGLSL